MKRLLLMCALLYCTICQAGVAEFEWEWMAVKSFLSSKGVLAATIEAKMATISEGREVVLCYDTDWFVLVAAEEYAEYLDVPILAYSLDGGFRKEDLEVTNLFMLHSYTRQLQYLKENGIKYTTCFPKTYPLDKTSVLPLLKGNKWGTGAPYNNSFPAHSSRPEVNTKPSSLAVAISQIMKYYEYPAVGRGQFAYNAGMKATLDFAKVAFDWDNIPDVYGSEATDAEKLAICKLLIASSVSVCTRFDFVKSLSKFDCTRKALVNHFGYSPQCVEYTRLSEDCSTDKLLAAAYQELAANRPLICHSLSIAYGIHDWVCDGYDDDYLHFNLGLSGVANGYYRMINREGVPQMLFAVVVGIEPDRYNELSKELEVKQPGTLSMLLSDEEKCNVRKLKIKGKLNNADVQLLRAMAGATDSLMNVDGMLMELNLDEASFVTDKKSHFMRKSAIGYSASAFTVTASEIKGYDFDFSQMDEKTWRQFCNLGMDSEPGFFFKKEEDGYYIYMHTQKGLVSRDMFKGCSNLRRVVLSKKIKKIDDGAFDDCPLLEEVIYGEKVEVESRSFTGGYAYGTSVKEITYYLEDEIEPKLENEIETKPSVSAVDTEEQVFHVVETDPTFSGGIKALMVYLNDNMLYPVSCKEKGVEGRVIVQFIVEKDGSISNAEILKSVHPELDAEAIRLISSMPAWSPGKHRGIPVRVKFTMPVTFQLDVNK